MPMRKQKLINFTIKRHGPDDAPRLFFVFPALDEELHKPLSIRSVHAWNLATAPADVFAAWLADWMHQSAPALREARYEAILASLDRVQWPPQDRIQAINQLSECGGHYMLYDEHTANLVVASLNKPIRKDTPHA